MSGPVRSAMSRHMIDIGANLTDSCFRGMYNGTQRHPPDVDRVLARAREAGVVRILVTAGTLEQSSEALELARSDSALFSTVGVHPTRADEMAEDVDRHLDRLSAIVREGGEKVVAIGECGLDYDRTQFCSVSTQKAGFQAQFTLAERFGLPMFLHNRNTGGDFASMVREHRSRFREGVVHSFTGTMSEMNELLELGLYIGINGCSLKTEDNVRVAAAVPLDRLMLETDCPYCEIRKTHAGYPHVRSKWPSTDKKKYDPDSCVKGRNEPCQMRAVMEVVAAAKQVPEEEVCAAAFNNTMRVFFAAEAANMGPSPYEWSGNATLR